MLILILSSLIIILSVIADQITKYLALTNLKPINAYPFIDKIIEFRYATNPGIAWGMLEGKRWLFIPISSIAIIAMIVIIFCYRKSLSPYLAISLSMIAGGGIGNQIDRIARGYVIDFLNFQFIDFPIFNVADCFVCVGCVGAIISVLFFDRNLLFDEKPQKNGNVKND